MTRKFNPIAVTLIAAALFFTITASAFSQSAIKLEYKFPEGKPFAYKSSTNIVQSMDFGGMQVDVNVDMILNCTAKSTGMDGSGIKLNITVDTMVQNITSPNGSAGGPIDAVRGKSFAMVLSPSGKELDTKEAQNIKYTSEAGGEATLAQTFLDFFPDIPVKPVSKGDSWISNDTVTNTVGVGSQKTITEYNYKFEGIENLDGVECVRLSAITKGSMQQTSQTQGMDLATSGTFTGTQELFFDAKNGVLIKQVSRNRMNGTIEITGAQNITAPIIMDISSNLQLKK